MESRVVCYQNKSKVKEGRLKYNMKERLRKTIQTMQLNKEIKQKKLYRKKRNKK